MSLETAKLLIDRAFEENPEYLSFCFQGGEPTIAGLPYFKQFVEYVKKLSKPGQVVHYAIQTNGILIDEQWAQFLKEHRFLVGLSIDGPQKYHDALRVDPDSKGTLRRVECAWKLLQKYGVETNILSVISAATARHASQIYSYLKGLGANYLQFIACLDPLDEVRGGEGHSLTPERYGKFLCNLFDCWYTDFQKGQYVSIRQFDDWVHNLAGMPVSTCMSTGRCGAYLVIESDGSAYPCDFYVTDRHKLGMIQEESLSVLQSNSENFIKESYHLPEMCKTCQYALACRGGCKRDRLFESGTAVGNYFCPAYLALFDYAWDRIQELAAYERKAYANLNTGRML